MRILFLHHLPLAASAVGRLLTAWRRQLESAGHETAALVMDTQPEADGASATKTIVCSPDYRDADLPFGLPDFGGAPGNNGISFASLSDDQLALYREVMRRRLDEQIVRFDPHLIHAQHIWLQGQLALETGVPYLVNAWGPELADSQLDLRYQALCDQAAENAGRILVPNETVLRQVTARYESVADRTIVMTKELYRDEYADSAALNSTAAEQLIALYQAILEERFGRQS